MPEWILRRSGGVKAQKYGSTSEHKAGSDFTISAK